MGCNRQNVVMKYTKYKNLPSAGFLYMKIPLITEVTEELPVEPD